MARRIFFPSFLLCVFGLFFSCISCTNRDTSKEPETNKPIDSLAWYKADSLNARAKSLFTTRSYEEARALFDQVDTLFKQQQRYEELVLSKVNKASTIQFMFKPVDTILKPLREGLAYAKNLDASSIAMGDLYEKLASTYQRIGEHKNVQYYGEKAIEIYSQPNNSDHKDIDQRIYNAYSALIVANEDLGNFDLAEEYCLKQLEMRRANGGSLADATKELFIIYFLSEQTEKADAVLRQIEEERFMEGGSIFVAYDFYAFKADYNVSLGRYDEALASLEELEDIINESPFKAHFSQWFMEQRKANIQMAKGEYEKVIEIIGSVPIPSEQDLEVWHQYARDQLYLCEAYRGLGLAEEAKGHIQNAINYHSLPEERTDDFLQLQTFENMARKERAIEMLTVKGMLAKDIWEQDGASEYFEVALHNLEGAHQLVKEVGGISEEDQFITAERYDDLYVNLLDLYLDLWEKQGAMETFFKALSICDESKSVSQLMEIKTLRQNRLFEDVSKEIRQREVRLIHALDSLQMIQMGSLGSLKNRKHVDSVQSLLSQLKEEIRKAHPNYYNLVYGADTPIGDIISSHYAEDNVIEFFEGTDVFYVFAHNSNRSFFDKIERPDTLQEQLDLMCLALRDPGNSEYMEAGNEIYEALFAKYLDPQRNNILVLDGALHSLALDAIPNKDDNTEFLLEKISMHRLASLSYGHSAADENNGKAIIFAPFAGNSGGTNRVISGSLAEAKNVKKNFGGMLRIDEQANKDAFLKHSDQYSLIHLATHSEINRKSPLKSTIYFSDIIDQEPGANSLLISELYNMNLDSEMVTLSSCETGVGKEIKGRGVVSISSAFSYAGVPATVMSLWKVPDKETSKIMISFYDHLAKGKLKDEALREAKREYLTNTPDPALKHPYYWAGFVVSGDTSPIQASTPVWWNVVIGVLILGVIALGIHRYYWVRRKRT